MTIFDNFSKYYDIFYGSRNIKLDVSFITSVIKKFMKKPARKILDVGCGTGDHAIELAKRGYYVVGIDISKEMIKLAKKKSKREKVKDRIYLVKVDVRRLNLGTKFDVVIALYGVINYLVKTIDLIKMLKNVRNHLEEYGLFIFDFWHLPGQIRIFKPVSVWKLEKGNELFVKLELMSLNPIKKKVRVSYELQYLKDGIVKDVTYEEHTLRLFTIPEISRYLIKCGFEPLAFYEVGGKRRYTFNPPNENSAEVLCVTRPS